MPLADTAVPPESFLDDSASPMNDSFVESKPVAVPPLPPNLVLIRDKIMALYDKLLGVTKWRLPTLQNVPQKKMARIFR